VQPSLVSARLHCCGRPSTLPNGGEFGRVGLGWLNWQLKGDANAKKMFVGADCELCKPPSMWVVKKKMLD
jgi:hypothetical protein